MFWRNKASAELGWTAPFGEARPMRPRALRWQNKATAGGKARMQLALSKGAQQPGKGECG